MQDPLHLCFLCIWSLKYPLKLYWSLTSSRRHFLALLAIVIIPSPVSLPYLFKPYLYSALNKLYFSMCIQYQQGQYLLKVQISWASLTSKIIQKCQTLFRSFSIQISFILTSPAQVTFSFSELLWHFQTAAQSFYCSLIIS